VIWVLLLFVAGRCLVPMDETDVFFNLRLGEIILGTHRVPTENLLSFTHPHATDVNLAWLFQIVLALAHRAAGIPGTVLLKTAMVLAAWSLLYRVALRRGAHPALAALVLALAAWAAEPRFVERPHLVTFVGLAVLLLALEQAERLQPRLLWLLLPGSLLWANANSCFFLAPALLLLYAAGARLDGLHADARRAGTLALAMTPLMLATPSGWHALSYITNHFRMPSLRPLQEYRHALWPLDGPYFFLLVGLLVCGALGFRRHVEKVVPWRVLLPCLALALLGALRIRFVAEFAMLAGPALAVGLTRLLPTWSARWPTVAGAAVLVALTAAPRVSAVAEGRRAFDLGLEADLVPFAALGFAEANGLRECMYNDLEVGSYLTWQGWPRYPVFQDPRINGYPESFHAVLRRADLTRTEWQTFLDGFGVRSALVTYPDVNPRGALFDPELWALVYRAGDGLVFARRPLPSSLPELPLSFAYSPTHGLAALPLAEPPASSRDSRCAWKRALGDFHRGAGGKTTALAAYEEAVVSHGESACVTAARAAAGELALDLGDAAKAARLLDGLVDAVSRTNHGFALVGLGQPNQALTDFESVLATPPASAEATFGRGLALLAVGRTEEAAAAFAALLALAPNHVSAPVARKQLERLRSGAATR
jgi:tetratricopeptide (TPR) repeat protein